MNDLTVIYYTSNYLDDHNPYFLENTKKCLLKATEGLPMVIVSQKPTLFGPNSININLGNIGRSHLNLYKQILEGCKAAQTEWVAMAEDDVFYSKEHFDFKRYVHDQYLNGEYFLYDMNKVSLFTWSKPPMFSFRTKRKVVNHLIAPRKMIIEALEERFARLEELRKIWPEEQILKFWGDPGRYESHLGVKERKTYEFYSTQPGIVLSHEHAFGYLTQGNRKRLGDLKIIELYGWGRAEDILKLYKK